ncbi:MAG: dihydrofolate reductase [Candidatus Microsaccharimonas sp.]
MISAIVAVAKNGVIGNSNDIPWYLPADLRHFKDVTINHPVIMGRKTYDSIVSRLGHGLPNRQNVIVTFNPSLVADDVIFVPSIKQAFEVANNDDEIFVIGGAQIYSLAAPYLDRWYITEIDTEIEGDVTLKGFDISKFKEVSRQHHDADEKNRYAFDFVTYQRL